MSDEDDLKRARAALDPKTVEAARASATIPLITRAIALLRGTQIAGGLR